MFRLGYTGMIGPDVTRCLLELINSDDLNTTLDDYVIYYIVVYNIIYCSKWRVNSKNSLPLSLALCVFITAR